MSDKYLKRVMILSTVIGQVQGVTSCLISESFEESTIHWGFPDGKKILNGYDIADPKSCVRKTRELFVATMKHAIKLLEENP